MPPLTPEQQKAKQDAERKNMEEYMNKRKATTAQKSIADQIQENFTKNAAKIKAARANVEFKMKLEEYENNTLVIKKEATVESQDYLPVDEFIHPIIQSLCGEASTFNRNNKTRFKKKLRITVEVDVD